MSRRGPLLIFLLGAALFAGTPPPGLLTYNTLPLGSAETPLVLRTFVPDPGIDDAVFAHHGRGQAARKYNIDAGKDTDAVVPAIAGIPAAIAVNHGPALSYVFDTTEGRLLYAWQGGFLDMFPAWGDQELGNRVSYGYVPSLVGTLFYKAAGRHPVEIAGRSLGDLGAPHFIGYDLIGQQPTFIVQFGEYTVRTRVQPLTQLLGLRLELSVEPAVELSYRTEDSAFTVKQEAPTPGSLRVTLTGSALGTFAGYPRKFNLTTASVAAGEQLSRNYGCVGCHSTDGSVGYGPSWAALFNRERTFVDGTSAKADEAYLLESIKAPNAKIVQGFAPNFMPVYNLPPLECESLVLFIKSLASPQ